MSFISRVASTMSPLHVNIVTNEIADSLAKDGVAQPTINKAALTYAELHSTYINNKQSTVPPAHHWYDAKRSGGYLSLQCSRQGTNYSNSFPEWPPPNFDF
ncbi:RNase H domain-containing protein [Trichonephila clavipes]|nr:RNase H domain-containing protein [Trichonephila clavipes]